MFGNAETTTAELKDDMQITVELAAPLDKFAGVDRLTVELPEQATGTVLVRWLERHFEDMPAAARLLNIGRAMLFIESEYILPETSLKNGAHVRIVPYIPCCHP